MSSSLLSDLKFGARDSSKIIDMGKLAKHMKTAFDIIDASKELNTGIPTTQNSQARSVQDIPQINNQLRVTQTSYDLSSFPHWPEVKQQGSYGMCVNVSIADVLQFMSKSPRVSATFGHINTNFRLVGESAFNIKERDYDILRISKYSVDEVNNRIYEENYADGTYTSIDNQYRTSHALNYTLMNGTATIVGLSSMNIFGFVGESINHYPTIDFNEDAIIPTLMPTEEQYILGKRNAGMFPFTLMTEIYSGDALVLALKYCISVLNAPILIVWNVQYYSIRGAVLVSPPTNPGHIKVYKPDYTLGSHCSTLCGYDDSTSEFLLMNSWGTSFGLNEKPGYFKVSYDYIKDKDCTTELWSLVDTNNFVNMHPTGSPTVIPSYIEGSIASPLIIGIDTMDLYDLIDLTMVFMHGTTFTVSSEYNNATIINGYTLLVYRGTPIRFQDYKITVTATNNIGSCVKVFDVQEGNKSTVDMEILRNVKSELSAQKDQLRGMLASL